MLRLRVGQGLVSATDTTAVIVIKASADDVVLTCGGVAMAAELETAGADNPNLAPLDGSGYQSLPGFISDLCSNGGDGLLQFQNTQTLSSRQWGELDKALASDCGASTAEGG